MMTLQQRLLEVMDELGLEKPVDLANYCGVSEGLVSQWFSGTTCLGPKPLKAFARSSSFSLDWLTDGKLPKYRPGAGAAQAVPANDPPLEPPRPPDYAWLSAEEMRLVTLYRTTNDRERVRAMRDLEKSPREITPGIVGNKS